MNILFFSHLTSEFSDAIKPLELKYRSDRFIFARTKKEYKDFLIDAHILVTGNPSDDELKMAGNLKLIIVPFAGVAHLNRSLLKDLDIQAANSHGNAPIVAERALALAMACCGRIVEFHNDQKNGNWHRTGNVHQPFEYWFSMINKKVSILGTGAIGTSIAGLLRGFQCDIKGFRRNPDIIPGNFNSVTDNLEEALAFADIIFFALPSTGETKGLISKKNIRLLYNKFVINVGRGELIEEKPFFEALQSKEISGAGLDAWYDYPTMKNPVTSGSKLPFDELSNVVMSPHAGSHAPEGKMGQLTGALEVIDHYLEKKEVLNEIVDEY